MMSTDSFPSSRNGQLGSLELVGERRRGHVHEGEALSRRLLHGRDAGGEVV